MRRSVSSFIPRLGGMRDGGALATPWSREDASMVDVASFHADDCDALVAAALACPVCLRGDVGWFLDGDPYDPSASCWCRRCGHGRRVYLSGDQALRLAIAPVVPS